MSSAARSLRSARFVWTGAGDPYQDRYAADNRITGIVLKSNRMKISRGRDFPNAGGGFGAAGIGMMGGHKFGRDNLIRDVRVRGNVIRSPYIGIKVIGGIGETARSNRVICVPRRGNSIIGARKNLFVRDNLDGAAGNRVRLGPC